LLKASREFVLAQAARSGLLMASEKASAKQRAVVKRKTARVSPAAKLKVQQPLVTQKASLMVSGRAWEQESGPSSVLRPQASAWTVDAWLARLSAAVHQRSCLTQQHMSPQGR
jgi:hypothetical protein